MKQSEIKVGVEYATGYGTNDFNRTRARVTLSAARLA